MMIRRSVLPLIALAWLVVAPGKAGAVYSEGQTPPDFHKTDLDGIPQTLYQYRGKVVVLFLLGAY